MDIDQSKYTRPIVMIAEALVPVSDYEQTDPDDLRPDADMLVDEFIITEDTLQDDAVDPGAHWSHLGGLLARWFTSTTATRLSSAYNLLDWQTEYQMPWVERLALTYDNGILKRRLQSPVLLKSDDGFICDWENPSVARVAALLGGTIVLFIVGRGLTTGQTRVLELSVTIGASAGGGAAGTTGTAGISATSRNSWGENILISQVGIRVPYFATLAADYRWLSHIRIRPAFGSGPMYLCKDNAPFIPLVCFGVERGASHRAIIIRPEGGPMLVTHKEPPIFEFRNASAAVASRAIVTAWARICP